MILGFEQVELSPQSISQVISTATVFTTLKILSSIRQRRWHCSCMRLINGKGLSIAATSTAMRFVSETPNTNKGKPSHTLTAR